MKDRTLACLDISHELGLLSALRPIFHSEADFQHAFAWNLHEHFPQANVRLEYRAPWMTGKAYLDLSLEDNNASVALELKYKTRR